MDERPVPELYNDIFVVGDSYEQYMFAKMFVRARCRKAKSMEESDMVVFTGGTDVNPALYGEKPHHSTDDPDTLRDKIEKDLFEKCVELGIPMLGVCRGAQFGHVMMGGKLYQDVDEHYGDHTMWDITQKKYISKVSSVHHQAVIKQDGMEVIGMTGKSRNRWFNDTDKSEGLVQDIEAFFYRDTCFFGIQGHPEYSNYDEFMVWTFDMINKLVNENPDLTLVNGYRRIKPELLFERKAKLAKEIN